MDGGSRAANRNERLRPRDHHLPRDPLVVYSPCRSQDRSQQPSDSVRETCSICCFSLSFRTDLVTFFALALAATCERQTRRLLPPKSCLRSTPTRLGMLSDLISRSVLSTV